MDLDAIRALLVTHLPAYADGAVVALGAGTDHAAYLVDAALVVRVGASDAAREAALLHAVAAVAPVAVPEPVLATGGVLAYRRLPGVPLLDMPAPVREARAPQVGAVLGALLHALWSLPRERAVALADVDATPLAVWADEARAHVATLHEPLVAALGPAIAPALARFAATPPPPEPPLRVLTHADLGSEHVLVDGAAVTGVIDWSDAAITDPAKDLGLVLRDLGTSGLDAALARCGAGLADPPAVVARAWFYARCLALEDLAYGLAADGPAYVDAAIRAVARLLLADTAAER